MYTNAVLFPLSVAVMLVGLAIFPGMLADDRVDLADDDQPMDVMEIRSPPSNDVDLRYLLQNFLDNREVRAWSPIKSQTSCVGDRCRYAWKRGFESAVPRINSRGAPAWATSQFSNGGCSGASCLAGWKRGFRVLPQRAVDDEN
ncbi:uncharacterized protein [Diadema setosum]|uniref:uncharacterized protein n=1 Tax=Diadema antillarum TaxID=105358 RepID=UPI003A879635